jgi:hypothetical protein
MLDDIAGEGRLYIGPGTWALADPFTLSGGTDVYCAPGALFSLANLPSGSVLYTAAGSLSSAYTLSANAPMLVGAQPWAVSTIDVPQAYVVGDRRAYFGASWICMQNHTASSVSPPTIPTAAVAFNTDYLAGKWERTNVKTAASLTGIAANDRLIVQHDVRHDCLGLLNVEGETFQVLSIAGSAVNVKGQLHHEYLTAENAYFRKMNTVKKIRWKGGRFIGRTDLIPSGFTEANNQSTAFLFEVCEDVRLEGIAIESMMQGVGLRDCVDFETRSMRLEHFQGLGYGINVQNGSSDCRFYGTSTNDVRHAWTISAEPGRAGPRGITFDGFTVHYSQRYTASASSPLGALGDATDTHANCWDITYRNGDIFNATGAGTSFEGTNLTIENLNVYGSNLGVSVGNNTRQPSAINLSNINVYDALTQGVAVRFGVNALSGGFSEINLSNVFVDGAGTIPVYIAGRAQNRLSNVTLTNVRGKNSAYGAYTIFLAYVDDPHLSEVHAETVLTSQNGIAVLNYVGGHMDNCSVRQLGASANATAYFLSNTNNTSIAGRRVNVGNGTLTLGEPALLPGAQDGIYQVRLTTVVANGGIFTFYDIDGTVVDTIAVGATHGVLIDFVIADGSIDFALGDGWDIEVDGESVEVTRTATNVGGATMAIPSDTVIDDDMEEGEYSVICTNATVPATWSVTDPSSGSMGTATSGTQYDSGTGMVFTITAAGTATVVGDRFTVTGRRMGQRMNFSPTNTLVAPDHGANRFIFQSNTVKNNIIAKGDWSQATTGMTMGSGGGHVVIRTDVIYAADYSTPDVAAIEAWTRRVPLDVRDGTTATLIFDPTAEASADTPEARHAIMQELVAWNATCHIEGGSKLQCQLADGYYTVNA